MTGEKLYKSVLTSMYILANDSFDLCPQICPSLSLCMTRSKKSTTGQNKKAFLGLLLPIVAQTLFYLQVYFETLTFNFICITY